MKLHKRYPFLAGSLATALLLAACGSDSDQSASTDEGTDSTAETEEHDFPADVQNEGEAIDGGVARVGIVTDTAWTGIFDWAHYDVSTDSTLNSYFLGELFTTDDNFALVGGEEWGTAANVEFDEENATVTVTIRDGVKWHDGEPLTADDYLFAHEVVGHPDYSGIRYGEDFTNIVGMEEYHAGEADTISGITVSEDGLSATIQYKEFNPTMKQAGGGVWGYAMPRHHLGDIPVGELESHENIRQNPIGFGPFKVKNSVQGESLELERFDDYFAGTPKLDGITLERVPVSGVIESLNAGEFDWVDTMPIDQYDSFRDGIPGYTTIGYPGQSYDYIGFKMGEWNAEEGVVEYNPDAKMADKNLRQAMGYALDIDRVAEEFYSGLRTRANSHIIPNFSQFHKDDLEGYPYDPDRANQLLDEAGYVDTDGDGLREDPDGEPLAFTYAARSGSEVAETIAYYFIQSWNEIGLDVSLLEGRLHEGNAFYDRVQADDPEIDVYEAGWGVGADPTPFGLYGNTAPFNFPRYESEENNKLLEELVSDEAFDLDYRVDKFHEWQEYFMDEAVTIPTFWRTELQLVNNRVSAFSHSSKPTADPEVFGLHQVYLTAEEPVTE